MTQHSSDSSSSLRPHLTVVFAIVVIWLAGRASAQEQLEQSYFGDAQAVSPLCYPPIQFDAQTMFEDPTFYSDQVLPYADSALPARIDIDPATAISRSNFQAGSHRADKPVTVELSSALANLDADSDPDGWRAQVVLRDREGNLVVARSNATFKLIPRIPLADHQQFTDADVAAATWSMPLKFDQRGVAMVTLPLRQSLKPIFGWSSAIAPSPFDQVGARSRNHGRYRNQQGAFGRDNTVVRNDWRDRLGMPSTAVMQVRVSVPGSGVFEAVSPVWIRPPSLVDSRWPYR
ncbi:hypothetical protein Pla22_16450 [Rubripirellula amarantea]|uniref:Uncharacterized protein n=1 Tax=Rubripirellula amarantea TaxID=2527999 RepID=A0A5C5WV82_9BACT|nr:hypothetical protein [Rubripirellula amarantea]TWT54011.1 hypothetical protein Pla22_16450 [Rubripirellula amarantea]